MLFRWLVKGCMGLGVVVLLVLAAGAWSWSVLSEPLGERVEPYTIEKGARLRGVLEDLEAEGVLRHWELVYVYARITGNDSIRSGAYQIEAGLIAPQLVEKFHAGRVITRELRIVEGLNKWDIGALLQKEGWMRDADFQALCHDTKFLEASKIPSTSCEGFIFPETYRFASGIAPKIMLRVFFQQYKQAYAKVVAAHGVGPMSFDELSFVTLASIIEKETGVGKERPHIACVFYNRMQAQPAWPLQTDPTVIYAARLEDPSFDGNLKHYHLRQMKHPYNTYLQRGLPPGPIASPGFEALAATAKPLSCKDFFFVSKNNGEHEFCDTLTCHENAVQRWQVNYFRKAAKVRN